MSKLLTFMILATVVFFSAVAMGATHQAWCRAAIARLPVFHEDKGDPNKQLQLEQIADAISIVSKKGPVPPRQWAALILAVGSAETNFSTRIIAGRCKKHECDGGRARGFAQNHRNAFNAEIWENANGSVENQVRLADDGLRRAFNTCRQFGAPFPHGALRAYAGSSCSKPMKGEALRVATYQRLLLTGT